MNQNGLTPQVPSHPQMPKSPPKLPIEKRLDILCEDIATAIIELCKLSERVKRVSVPSRGTVMSYEEDCS